jgi:DNA polymerase family A
VKGAGSQTALQAKLRKAAAAHPHIPFPTTPAGRYATDADTLTDLAAHLPFVADLLEYRAADKLLESFLNKLDRPVVRPSFGVLARTGRTTSFGELNAQNLPRDPRVRNCFVPSPGHVFLDLDFVTVELVALAQACLSQFGSASAMAARINAGDDLHRVFAGYVTGQPPERVSKEDRDRVKPINFGKPGGMGDRALQEYARTAYGVTYTDAEVGVLSGQWLALFPEMQAFLADGHDTPLALARRLDLTPVRHHEHTGDPRFARHPDNRGRGDVPNAILGAMCLKVLGTAEPRTGGRESYRAADVDFFWARLESLAAELSAEHALAVRDRAPSPALRRAVTTLVDRAAVFVLTGRLRAAAGYTARHNTVFQGLASDGAKLALWRVWRAGYRVVNFVHDQLLVEVPAGDDLRAHAERVRAEMEAGMRAVVPDVRVAVEYAATDRWQKGAKAVYDARGRLVVWTSDRTARGADTAPTGTTSTTAGNDLSPRSVERGAEVSRGDGS